MERGKLGKKMEYRRLGRTGLNVSVISLGSGGENRLGQSRHTSPRSIHQLVRHALELGINFFDTASTYEHSESLLGAALRGVPRENYYLATKVPPVSAHRLMSAAEARRLVERSLQSLGVEELDILQLHRVTAETYAETRDRLMPELQKLRAEGKVRYLGITESSRRDEQHRMLERALRDDLFDTVMVAYHLANTTAEDKIFPLAQAHDAGVIGMAAARHQVFRSAVTRLRLFSRTMTSLVMSPPSWERLKIRLQEGRSLLLRPGPKWTPPVSRAGGGSPLVLPAAAYTFAVSQPAIATVLTGTTEVAHLEQNVAAALAPAMTLQEIKQLRALLY
jgi:L-galactose dehydrogenase